MCYAIDQVTVKEGHTEKHEEDGITFTTTKRQVRRLKGECDLEGSVVFSVKMYFWIF